MILPCMASFYRQSEKNRWSTPKWPGTDHSARAALNDCTVSWYLKGSEPTRAHWPTSHMYHILPDLDSYQTKLSEDISNNPYLPGLEDHQLYCTCGEHFTQCSWLYTLYIVKMGNSPVGGTTLVTSPSLYLPDNYRYIWKFYTGRNAGVDS